MEPWYLKNMIFKLIHKLTLLLILALILAVAIWVYRVNYFIQNKPFQVDAPGYVVVVPPGLAVQKLADQLAQAGVLKHPTWFVWWVRLTDVRSKIKAGEYLIKPGMTPQAMIDMMVAGRVIQHALTIVEGWTFERMMQMIDEAPKLTHALKGLSPADIMAKIGHPDEHPEGRFFPDTYYFPAGTSDIAFLQRAYNLLNVKLNNAWNTRDQNLFLKSSYDALILASIIEKESSVLDEYSDIAGVYIRRLARKMPLQADPTVVYGLQKNYNGKLTLDMLKIPTPYNTYTMTGLPPTPIAMPGEKALQAAVHPKPGETLYFVARGEGKGHVFSRTLEEHLAAVQQYRKALNGNSNTLPVN